MKTVLAMLVDELPAICWGGIVVYAVALVVSAVRDRS